MSELPPIKLPPCDHDECPPTRCIYEGRSERAQLERTLADAEQRNRDENNDLRAKLTAVEGELQVANKDIATLEKEMASERQELASLREDKERLDWLDQNFTEVVAKAINRFGTCSKKFQYHLTFPEPLESLRQAIDAARK